MTKNDTLSLSARQQQAIPIFASMLNVEEACRLADISRNTFYEWLKQPLFKAELDKLRNEFVEEAIMLLKVNASKASKTLVTLTERDDSPGVQRAAANDILNHLFKYKEMEEIEVRLENLERQLKEKKI